MANGLLFNSIWYDRDEGAYVGAIVLVKEQTDSFEVVIEPREGGELAGIALSRDEWVELREFVDGQFKKLVGEEAELAQLEYERDVANGKIRK